MALALAPRFSSTGAISQLVATGQMNAILEAQDGGATLFRSTFSKISPFALNQEIIQAGGSACCHCNFASDSSHTFQVPRASDAISRVYLKLSLPGLANVTDGKEHCADEAAVAAYGADNAVAAAEPYYKSSVGHYVIRNIDVSFGNSKIDELSGELMHMLLELSGKAGQREGLDEMIGRGSVEELKARSKGPQIMYTPIPFYFASGISGLALPIVSLQFHDVEFSVDLRSIQDCVENYVDGVTKARSVAGSAYDADGDLVRMDGANAFPDLKDAKFPLQMEAMSIYLGQAERMRFAAAKQEILICQNQKQTKVNINGRDEVDLKFNHCVSELVMGVPRNDSLEFYGHEEALTKRPREALESFSLSLNNQDRTQAGKESQFYRLVSPFQHHQSIPRSQVYSISFALHPDQINQPSGSLNMSRVDDVVLHIKEGAKGTDRGDYLYVYARSWNVVRLSLGISGLAYSF